MPGAGQVHQQEALDRGSRRPGSPRSVREPAGGVPLDREHVMNTNNPPNKSRPVRCDDIEVECQKALDAGIPVIWDGMHNCWHPQDGWEPIYLTHFGNTAHNAVQFQPATKTATFKC